MIHSSVDFFGDKEVFLVKDKPGGVYQEISYHQFQLDIDALGTALVDAGLKGKKIAVMGENRYEWVVSYFAVTNGTGVIVPIDRELKAEEMKELLLRAKVSAIIYSGKYEKVIEDAIKGVDSIEHVIGMDAMDDYDNVTSLFKFMNRGRMLLKNGNRDFLDTDIDPEAMTALLFTSGTTGMPKGVMLSHKNFVSNVMHMSEYVGFNTDKRGLSVLPMHHTYEFTCHIMTPIYQGMSIAICEGLKYIVKNMAEAKATVLVGVPLIFEKMHQKVWKQAESSGKTKKMQRAIAVSKVLGGENIKATKRLFGAVHNAMGGKMELFIAGGAAIDPEVIKDFNAMGMNMIQGYGMTENAPIIDVNKDRYHKAEAAGFPLKETNVLIVDKDENGIGEIICQGPSVMIGYYEDPEATAEILKDGWLYTGDFGYMDNEGFLYVTGRKKNLIVTKNGKNISPEEIEYYLLKSPYIEEVIVWGKEESSGDTVVCADIFPSKEELSAKYGKVSDGELRKIISAEVEIVNDRMPAYKRVKRFELRDEEFEKTTSQKIKRHNIKHK
jgi:long-chain acyl-CoA synthetase